MHATMQMHVKITLSLTIAGKQTPECEFIVTVLIMAHYFFGVYIVYRTQCIMYSILFSMCFYIVCKVCAYYGSDCGTKESA